ncbi:MAG: hypothetical protein ACRD43_00665 [Pyrinomonadaceae bacterium]
MSKLLKAILPVGLPLLLIFQFFNNSPAQEINAEITVPAGGQSSAAVSGRFNGPRSSRRRNLWFLKSFAGYDRLGERFSALAVTDAQGHPVSVRQLIPGEFLADGDLQNWNYTVDLSPPKMGEAAAHVSWIAADRGLIFLDDVLPQTGAGTRATVEFVLPPGWEIVTTERKTGDNKFEVTNAEKAVFVIGRGFRDVRSPNKGLHMLVSGDRQFSDGEAVSMANEIYDGYKKTFRIEPSVNVQIALMRFPGAAGPGIWEADTRGSSVTVLSSDMPFKTQSLQRLHEQLRHEIFHLWIPNGVNLSGSYDWFYEGFALYLSLKNGVLMNRIRFDDFLDTLSRAYMIDRSQKPRLSLIEASKNRSSVGNTTVYARGLITAFLCDLVLLRNSKGKMDASNIAADLFDRYHSQPAAVDGNDAVFGVMQKYPGLSRLVENYVKGNAAIDWTSDLAPAGIVAGEQNSVTVLKTLERPTGRQREMLDKLGYNSWQKLTDSSK